MPSTSARVPVALTIAGSDSGGGAGLQADLRSFRAFGVHGCSVVSALTAQNPHGVRASLGVPPDFLRAQLEAVAEDFDVRAVKTGMLFNAETIEAVADSRHLFPSAQWVIDPVMVATSGAPLLDASAVSVLRARLLPGASLITPNLPEASALLGRTSPISSFAEMVASARALREQVASPILLKGGHLADAPAVDVLADAQGKLWRVEAPTIPNPATTHGTGCALASAIAANLALALPLLEAVAEAKAYLLNLLSSARPAGRAAVYAPEAHTFSRRDVAITPLD